MALSSDSFRNEAEVFCAAGRKKKKKREKREGRGWRRERLGEQQGKLRCCWKLVVALVEREAMVTESPVRMLSSGGGMRGGIGGRVGLGDGLRGGAFILGGGGGGAHHHHHHISSLMIQEGEAELGLLLNRRTRLELSEKKKKGAILPPQRSGSAPPNVEGSFAAMGGLFSCLSTNPKSGSGGARGVSKAQSGEGGGGDFVVLDAEQQQRSDPAYLIYYYTNINLNPRLPPPLISWENYRLAQRLQSGMKVVGGGHQRQEKVEVSG